MTAEFVITKETPIIEVLEKCPGAAAIFSAHGFDCAMCMGAEMETLEEGAIMHGAELGLLLDELNAACRRAEADKDG